MAQQGFVGAVLSGVSSTLGGLFGGAPDAKEEVSIEVLFGLLGLLAKADSIVTSHETELVNGLMVELKLSSRGKRIAHEAFQRGRNNQLTASYELQRFLDVFPKGSPEVAQLYDGLLRLAAADGRIRQVEREFLVDITKRLGYDLKVLDDRLAMVGKVI